jgi:hypothetical protein
MKTKLPSPLWKLRVLIWLALLYSWDSWASAGMSPQSLTRGPRVVVDGRPPLSELSPMMSQIPICLFAIAGSCVAILSAILPANAQVNVTQFHNHDSRDGLYIDSAFTPAAAANLTRDLNFDGTIEGNVYAQPLYLDNGPGGRATIIAVTESNNVYALDALDGSIIWERNVGPPVSADDLICTKFDPMGVTSTPVVDLASRALFLDAMTTPDGGTTKKHLIFSLNVDTGDINPGWPVDVEATATYNGINFTAAIQQQRPALGIVGNILYVGYGSMRDCSLWHGWLVGVPIDNPSSVTAWAAATSATGGAIWGVGGIASDGVNPFVTTGNTSGTGGNWSGGEAVIRFQPGPIFSGSPSDYWGPYQLAVARSKRLRSGRLRSVAGGCARRTAFAPSGCTGQGPQCVFD